MSQSIELTDEWRPKANPWLIAVVVTLVAFMEVLDTTIVNVALPHIAGSLSSSNDESTWVLTSYLVANGIVLMISGFFTRLLGRKRYFLICIVMFTVCSFLCGVAQSLPQIVVFRLLQGFFGGGLQPIQQSIILDSVPRSQRATAFAITALAIVVAPVVGPVLGGWITDSYSWRWIFLINIPVGVVTFLGVIALVDDPPWLNTIRKAKVSVDYVGLGLITLGLGTFQIVLDRGEDADWLHSGFIRIMAVFAVTGITGAVCWLLYAKKPIVDIRVMADRNFGIGCLLIAVMTFVLYASSVLLPQLAQEQFGYTATWAGLILMPGAVGLIMLILVMGRIMPFIQTRLIIAFGFLFLAGACAYSMRLTPDIDFRSLVNIRVFQSLGIGFLFVPISAIAYLSLPARLNGDAAALFTMFRNVAGSVGISVSTAFVTSRTQVRMAYLHEGLTPFTQAYDTTLATMSRTIAAGGAAANSAQQRAFGHLFQDLINQAQILAYTDVFAVCAILSIIVVPFTLLLSPAKAAGAAGGH